MHFFEGREGALHHGDLPEGANGPQAAAGDPVDHQQQPGVIRLVLAALVRIDERLLELDPAVAELPIDDPTNQEVRTGHGVVVRRLGSNIDGLEIQCSTTSREWGVFPRIS